VATTTSPRSGIRADRPTQHCPATCVGCRHVRKGVSERDLNPTAVTCGVADPADAEKRISAGQSYAICVRGGIDPITPYCSISHSAEINL